MLGLSWLKSYLCLQSVMLLTRLEALPKLELVAYELLEHLRFMGYLGFCYDMALKSGGNVRRADSRCCQCSIRARRRP